MSNYTFWVSITAHSLTTHPKHAASYYKQETWEYPNLILTRTRPCQTWLNIPYCIALYICYNAVKTSKNTVTILTVVIVLTQHALCSEYKWFQPGKEVVTPQWGITVTVTQDTFWEKHTHFSNDFIAIIALFTKGRITLLYQWQLFLPQ